ncbi:MAG: BREX system ATP-binding domain-containing protein [Caldilineaceae bacterium]
MATLHAQLLGGFLLYLEHAPVPGLEQSRYQRLLAYLFLHHPTPLSRQHLAFLFWPDSSERQSRTNLRNLIHRLHKNWPEMAHWIDASGADIEWRADAEIEVDVAQFAAALAAANVTADPSVKESHLRQATDCYRGDLLPDIYDDWALGERERLRTLYVQALEQLSQLLEDDQRYAEAIDFSQRLLRHEPLQESAYRHLMRLYALAGDRAAALRVYHTCVTTFQRELSVEPSTQTSKAYERLLNLTDSPRTESLAAQQLPFVGRRKEWQQILRAWQRVRQGKSHLLLINGEAGIGKTRLAEELMNRVRRQGFAAASARSYAAEGTLAYAPVTEWLRSPPLQRALGQVDDIWLVEVARLLPEILPQRPHLPSPGPLQESWQQQRFFEGLARLFAAAAHPLLLLLDDLQWTDEESLKWLHFLLRSSLSLRVLVVATLRLGELDNEPPLSALLQPLRAAGRLAQIDLGPLTADETTHLAGQMAGSALSTHAQARLFQESEGNPLFLVETLRAGKGGWLAEEEADDLPPFVDRPAPSVPLPPKIDAVISARLAQLSAPARQLAGLAAVIGRQFTFALLRAASETDDDALVQALDELWRRRIVREQGEDAYDFSHGHIRAVAYRELSQARLRLLHKRVAGALERLAADRLDETAARLAAHWEGAGDRPRAVHYYLQAGEQALVAYLPRQAQRYFAHTLCLAEGHSTKADAYFGRGRALFALEKFEPAIHAFQQALDLMDPTDPRRGKVLYAIADVYSSALYDLAAAEPFIRQARAAAESAQDWETVCQSLSLLGQLHSSQGNLAEEMRLIQQAQAIARRTNNRWREGRTLADLAFLLGQQSGFREAESTARQALALLQETDDKAGIAFAWNLLGRALGGRGDYSAAFAAFSQSETVAAAIELRSLLAQVPNMRAWLHQQLCDYASAQVLDREGVALAQGWGKLTAEISARLNLCLDRCYLGDPVQALVDLEQLEPKLGEKQYGYHAWRWRLRLLHAKGLCCLKLGRMDEARDLAEAGLALAQSTGAQKYTALNQALAGEALAGLGMWAEVAANWQAALALADRIEYQPLRWQGRYELAQMYRQRDEADRADILLAEAVEIARAIGERLDDEALRQTFLAAPPVVSVLAEGARVQPR